MLKKKLIIYLSFLLGLFFYFGLIKNNVFAGWLVNSQGQLLYQPGGQILGKKEKPAKPEQAQSQTQIKLKEKGKSSEAKLKNKVLLERHGYKIRVKLRDEKGNEVEIPEGSESAEFEIEEPGDKTTKVMSRGNAFVVIKNKIGAQTHFPLMVDLETNELIVTTPAGQKVVTVLPDKAVENMLAANVLDQLGGKGGLLWLEYQEKIATESAEPGEATEAAAPEEATEAAEVETELEAVDEVINLTMTEDGVLAYQITGLKYEKLLGLFKVKLPRTVFVSAETGELLKIREDLLIRILDIFSV